MRSIFWKIFLSFWLVMVLITAVAVLTSFQLARTYSEFVDEIDRRNLMQEAAVVVTDQGVDGFRQWLGRDAVLPSQMTIYLIDTNGVDALGRKIPPRVKHHWRRFRARVEARADRHRKRPPRPDKSSRSFEYTAPDGQSYRPVLGPEPPRVFGVLGVPRIAFLVLCLGVLISAVICYVLSRYLARPITRIASTAELLASGKLDSRVGPSAYRADEIGGLAKQFDRMALELENSETSRRELFRNISHELRSPLARINVALELARRTPSDVQTHLQRIGTEAEHMERLIAQVLELVRVQQELVETAQSVNLTEVLESVVEDARFEGQPANKRVELNTDGAVLRVTGYRDVLSSAIENVLRNAIAHTPVDSVVEVTLRTTQQGAVITVCDQGPGVPEQDIVHLFEPFYRHSDSTIKGAGVGLAITAQGIALMGGTVGARNAADTGLCVEVVLPVEDTLGSGQG